MKRIATGFLAGAAMIFVVTFFLPDNTAVGYVRAAAEAGMVGGLADWFAVTALFRYPLGLRIPHTALIPTRKDALAENLGQFVTEHFLTREALHGRLVDAQVAAKVGAQLANPAVADRLAKETVAAAATALQVVKPDDVTDTVLEFARRETSRRRYSAVAGRFLADRVEGGAHKPLIDIALPYLRRAVVDHRDTVRAQIKSLLERYKLVSLFATDKRVDRLVDTIIVRLGEMERDPDHRLRRLVEEFLQRLADDLQHDENVSARVDDLLREVLDDRKTRDWASDVLAGSMTTLRATLDEPDNAVQQRIAQACRDLGARAVNDREFAARLEGWAERATLYLVDNYADEFTRLIRDTVARWDGPATARRIELAAGRDLQFIRVNGTIVGALAGVVIHAAAVLLD